jgi:hypothetical protein
MYSSRAFALAGVNPYVYATAYATSGPYG